MFNFKVLKKSTNSRARLGILETAHGIIETPAFVPVATQAAIKTLTSEEAFMAGSQILIANAYHLHLRPGEKIVKSNGGLHKFMNWPRPLMTDSGGFQVFSLGFGRDHGVGKIIKTKAEFKPSINIKSQPTLVKIKDEGVVFRSPYDGKELFIGPKESVRIQETLGADIIFSFDECTSPLAGYGYTEKSLKTTHRWADACLAALRTKQALFGIVQGGKFENLRIESAKFAASRPFDGFGIGGEFGDDKKIMTSMLRTVIKELPESKPRHLLGIGHLEDIPKIIKEGVDLFDCIVPTHYARRGVAFTSEGRLDLNKAVFLNPGKSQKPIDPKCNCQVCRNYTRSYITHLLKANEMTPLRLLTFHNLYFFNSFVEKIRQGIKNGTF